MSILNNNFKNKDFIVFFVHFIIFLKHKIFYKKDTILSFLYVINSLIMKNLEINLIKLFLVCYLNFLGI